MVKKILLGLLLVILAVAGYVWYKFATNKGGGFEGDKAKKLEFSSDLPAFNQGFAKVLTGYFELKEALVNADTAASLKNAATMLAAIDSLKMDEIKKDTSKKDLAQTIEDQLLNVKNNTAPMAAAKNIGDVRTAFDKTSQEMLTLLNAVGYKGEKIYYQRCPMAFGADKEAFWLDKKTETQKTNPFLGKKDPVYKASMLNCGEEIGVVGEKK